MFDSEDRKLFCTNLSQPIKPFRSTERQPVSVLSNKF